MTISRSTYILILRHFDPELIFVFVAVAIYSDAVICEFDNDGSDDAYSIHDRHGDGVVDNRCSTIDQELCSTFKLVLQAPQVS